MDYVSDNQVRAGIAIARYFPYIGWIALGIALLLVILKAALTLPSGYGIDDFLGFIDSGAVAAAHSKWAADTTGAFPLLLAYGIAYLAIDLALFIPFYTVTSLRVGYWLDKRLRGAESDKFTERHWLVQCAAVATAVLVPIDLVETTIGSIKLGQPLWGLGAAALGIIILVIGVRLDAVRHADRKVLGWAATISLVVVLLISAIGRDWVACGGGEWWLGLGCVAHRAKEYPIALMFLAPLAGMLLWLAGLQGKEETKARRTQLRAAIGDIVVRSRYVLAILAILTGLLFFGGQSRDMLVGMLTDTSSDHPVLTWAAILISLAALWTLSHSCWLWGRVACRVPGPQISGVVPGRNRYIEAFAKYWARALGVVPLLIFAQLASMTLHDLVVARANEGAGTLLIAAIAGLVFGAIFIIRREDVREQQREWQREQAVQERYFDDPSVVKLGRLRLTDENWEGPRYNFWFGFKRAPVWLPIASLAAMIVCRLPGSLGLLGWPPLAFASILFASSAWMGLFGWLWLVERRQSVPWVLLLIAVVGVLGSCQLTDNHVVWIYEQHRGSDSVWPMWLATAVLAAFIGGIGWWAVTKAPDDAVWRRVTIASTLVVGVIAVALTTDHLISGSAMGMRDAQVKAPKKSAAATTYPRAPIEAITLDDALAQWLKTLWQGAEKSGDKSVPVYFIVTEGGGVRAAYWTALALAELEKQKGKTFVERTFAISGVSGGSVGAAAFIACRRQNADPQGCIKRLGQTDLVSPLLGAFLFEDALAQVIPTSWCSNPACGFLSRGVWFERALQGGSPEMKDGLRGSRPSASADTVSEPSGSPQLSHLPYLFLNSTWVESGERAIASEIKIAKEKFPTALDEIAIMGHDLTLATAAHNSARFPVVNAIGSVRTSSDKCPGDTVPVEKPVSSASATDKRENVSCGHLADGGYFDNSGSHTVIDILHGLREFLAANSVPVTKVAAEELTHIRAWARRNLRPELFFIHNGIALTCDRPHQPTDAQVACDGDPRPFEPQAHSSGPIKVYTDFLGIATTAINVTGLGSNRRRADSLLIDEIGQLHAWLSEDRKTASKQNAEPEPKGSSKPRGKDERQNVKGFLYQCIDQINNGILYPLGWYLSSTARKGMENQVTRAVSRPRCAVMVEDTSNVADSVDADKRQRL